MKALYEIRNTEINPNTPAGQNNTLTTACSGARKAATLAVWWKEEEEKEAPDEWIFVNNMQLRGFFQHPEVWIRRLGAKKCPSPLAHLGRAEKVTKIQPYLGMPELFTHSLQSA